MSQNNNNNTNTDIVLVTIHYQCGHCGNKESTEHIVKYKDPRDNKILVRECDICADTNQNRMLVMTSIEVTDKIPTTT